MAMYEKQQELVEQVIEQMQICADMLDVRDESKASTYGFAPGLDEKEAAEKLRERIASIRQGIFQVMFTGTFNAGKSTLLNALLAKDILPMDVKPETAVVTELIFNSNKENATAYLNEIDESGSQAKEMMSPEEFFEKYSRKKPENEEFLQKVDHAVIEFETPGVAGGSMIRLVDSPGTRANAKDTEVALAFAAKANALVFVINGLQALDEEDKKYIATHFAKKKMENIFFVINKVNLLNDDDDIERLLEYIRKELLSVFEWDGVFNENLYEKRVFSVNALDSMYSRMGQKEVTILKKGREKTREVEPDEETGVPEFEASLAEFLSSGDRDKKALSAYRSQMADFYLLAEISKKKRLDMLSKGKEQVEAELASFQKEKGRIEREIQDISDDIEAVRRDILRDARDVYDDYCNAVESDWQEYFADKYDSIKVHTISMVAAKFIDVVSIWKEKEEREKRLDEKTKKATEDFKNAIEDYLRLKSDDMYEQLKIKLDSRIKALSDNLNRHRDNLTAMSVPIDLDEIAELIMAENNVKTSDMDQNNAKLGQALTGLLLGDPELIMEAGEGKTGTLHFLMDVIKVNVIDYILALIFVMVLGNIWGIVFFVAAKLGRTESKGQSQTEKFVEETMGAIINGTTDKAGNETPGLKKEGRIRFASGVETKLGSAMKRANHKLTEGIRERLVATERQLSEMVSELEKNENALVEEEIRTGKIMGAFAEAISTMSELTGDGSLTVNDLKALAAGEVA